MFLAVAGFELRQQLRGHVFWVVAAISTIMVLGSVGVDALRVGVSTGGLRNGAEAVIQTHLVWTLFFMFTTAAFVADSVLRDELTGFAPVVQALPLRRADLVLGRFAGAFAAVVLCFLSVPLALVVGPAMPWVAPESVGPVPAGALGFAFVVMAIPNLLLSASLGFALATAGRSMGAALVGAIALLVAYGLGARAGAALPAVVEPFGFAAYAEAIAGWAGAARELRVPALAGVLLGNRLLVLAASLLLLAAAALSPRVRSPRPASAKAATPMPTEGRGAVLPWIAPRFDRWTPLRQGAARFRFECGRIVRTPVFAALVLLGLANATATVWPLRETADAAALVRALSGGFQLTPIVVALFFAGELRWQEQERGLAGLLGATPLAPAAFLLPKFAALATVLLALTGATALAAFATVAAAGRPDAAALLTHWAISAGCDALVFAALTLFLQALAPNKVAGWGFTILFLVASLALDRLGLRDPLWRYGRYPGWPLPAAVSGEALTWPWRVGWALAGVLLLVLAFRRVMRPSTPGR